MAKPKCPKCGGEDFDVYELLVGTGTGYEIVYCGSCGHIIGVVSPYPAA